ncbi:MAG: tetratricopeptide repeat protein [Lutibacter sp.]|nr:MAG: tetratricopeptide repeat protein [Lutibacter sp.]
MLPIILTSLFLSCNSTENSDEFIKKVKGRYLYNSDETVEVYFKERTLYLKWRGANTIKPLNIGNETFFVKEMNEKIQFSKNPADNFNYLVLVPKNKNEKVLYNFKKLADSEKIPSDYLKNNEFDKALKGYLALQKKDSLDTAIKESNFNSSGYSELRKKNYTKAIHLFEINVALYPNSSNVYDSLGEAFMKSADTVKAIENYKKSLALDSGNKRAKRNIEKLEKKIEKN